MLDKNAIFRFGGVRSGFNPDSYRNKKSWNRNLIPTAIETRNLGRGEVEMAFRRNGR